MPRGEIALKAAIILKRSPHRKNPLHHSLSSSILYTGKKLLQALSFTAKDQFNSKGSRELLEVLKPLNVFKNLEKSCHRFPYSHSKNIIPTSPAPSRRKAGVNSTGPRRLSTPQESPWLFRRGYPMSPSSSYCA